MFKKIISDLEASISSYKRVVLTGEGNLKIPEVISVGREFSKVEFRLSKKVTDRIKMIHKKMLEQVTSGTPIYGTTTSYGGRGGVVLNEGDGNIRLKNAAKLSRAIVHVDVSTGDPIPPEVVRAAILIRINSLLPGFSGIRLEVLELLKDFLNNKITPVVGKYGSIGASGDLALNGRVVSCLLQLPEVKVWDEDGKVDLARKVLRKYRIKPIKLLPKEGLALVNGDNFSTAAAIFLVYESLILFVMNLVVVSLCIQALKGSSRNFHPILSELRPHKGQQIISSFLLDLLAGSKLVRQELRGHQMRSRNELIQDPYSIRCVPQYYGPDLESLFYIWETLEINANSVSDNPLWTTPDFVVPGEKAYQWVSGGNFLAMHVVECVDRLRKILVHIIKHNDRLLSRLVHPSFNNGLPANLSDKSSVSQAAFKGLQTQMGMYEVYSSLLSVPVSTAFGVHEEFNQDLTSHAFTSVILSWELFRIAKYALASGLIAACQAIDLRGGAELLSPSTVHLYNWLRKEVPYIKKEEPLGNYIEKVSSRFSEPHILKFLMNTLSKLSYGVTR